MQNQEKENQTAHSRILKFRAWDKNKNEMVYRFFGISNTDGQCFQYENPLGNLPYTLMQYTGLKDRNGKEIYEGDVVKQKEDTREVRWSNEHSGWFPFSVCSDPYVGGMECGSTLDADKCEIIGNLYENPDLIKN